MKKTIIFYMGYSDSFNGENYNKKNVFGSEINAIKLAESLTYLYNVYIFSNISLEDEIIWNGVNYLNIQKLNTFTKYDILVIVRYINFFIYFKNYAKKTFIWICDSIINPYYKGLRLDNNSFNLAYNLKNNINGLICLSDWHLSNVNQFIDSSIIKQYIIYNPIDISYYKDNVPIVKNRFIYVSDPTRGLEILIDCLINLQKNFNDLSLVVFRKNEFSEIINKKLKLLNNVILYNKESQNTVANEFLKSEYFFYPNNLCETFCNIAVEAQLYNTICIYNNLGGLKTTIADRGLPINYDINDPNYIEKTVNDIKLLMNNETKKNMFRKKGYEWAIKLDINNIKYQWINLFES